MHEIGPHDWSWSSEDQATYLKWRRWVLVAYGSIGVVASIAAIAWSIGL